MGSLALSLCYLAAGRVDAVCSLKEARAVDIAAAQLLLRELDIPIVVRGRGPVRRRAARPGAPVTGDRRRVAAAVRATRAHRCHVRRVWIGCSGWNYADWRERRLPEGAVRSHAGSSHYATLFDTVEVNSTFYRLPRREAVARWVEQTPDDFVFAVKASRYLTHIKRLTDLGRGVERFYERIEPLATLAEAGTGALAAPGELPPGRRAARRGARRSCRLAATASSSGTRAGSSPEVYDLLRAHGAALVIGDHPERPFQAHELTADWTFIRFHHGSRGRNGNYSEPELEEWAGASTAGARRVDVYAYFNNDWRGYAVKNGLWLRKRLAA